MTDRPGPGMPTPEQEAPHAVRQLLLALVVFGSAGLLLELLLLEHYESFWQWVPVLLLGAGIAAGVALGLRPGRAAGLTFRGVMVALVVAGMVGLVLHYRSNAAFEREMDAEAGGLALVWAALRGATPALAPGALVQIGLLGLILVYRHPALQRDAPPRPAR